MEAKCKGDIWSLSRASTLAPAWTRVFTTVAELLNQAARCRGVTWVGNRVEKQIKNYWSSLHQYMLYLKRILALIHFLFKWALWHGYLFVMVFKSMFSICKDLSKTKHRSFYVFLFQYVSRILTELFNSPLKQSSLSIHTHKWEGRDLWAPPSFSPPASPDRWSAACAGERSWRTWGHCAWTLAAVRCILENYIAIFL